MGMFLDAIIEVSQKPLALEKRGKDHLYGDYIYSVESKGGGPASTLVAAIKRVQYFEAMRQDKHIGFKGLDEWFESLAIFVVDPVAMPRDVDGQTIILDRRKRLCAQVDSSVIEDVSMCLPRHTTSQMVDLGWCSHHWHNPLCSTNSSCLHIVA